jgi:hypothetical protein
MSDKLPEKDTLPPPAGEDDAYNAATRIGSMPPDLLAKLRAEGVLPPEGSNPPRSGPPPVPVAPPAPRPLAIPRPAGVPRSASTPAAPAAYASRAEASPASNDAPRTMPSAGLLRAAVSEADLIEEVPAELERGSASSRDSSVPPPARPSAQPKRSVPPSPKSIAPPPMVVAPTSAQQNQNLMRFGITVLLLVGAAIAMALVMASRRG